MTNRLRCAGVGLALVVASLHAVSGEAPATGDASPKTVRVTAPDDLSLFVRQYGVGDTPIVLLTGGPGYSGDYLKDVALRLSQQHRVLLPDQRGTGRSVINPWDVSRVTIEASVADVEALRVHSGAEQIILVGHSWGGILAMAYAASHGAHVRALVLVDSGGANSDWNLRYSQNILARLQPEDLGAVLKAQTLMATDPEKGMVDMIRATSPAMMVDRELALRSAEEYSGPEMLTPAVTLAMQGWLLKYDLGDGLKQIDAPVLIVQGEHDPIGEKTARDIGDTFSRSALHFIDDAAHEPYVEQPTAFFALVEPFLAEHAGESKKE